MPLPGLKSDRIISIGGAGPLFGHFPYFWAEQVLAIIAHAIAGFRLRSKASTPLRFIASALIAGCAITVTPAHAQTRPATPPATGNVANEDTLPWLARLLESLKPSVDTSLPESSRAGNERLETMLDQGRAEQALPQIEQRLEESRARQGGGEDVQALFLKARALDQLGRRQEAKDLYLGMTQRYPELPEPWNNLAALEVRDGRLEQAKMALDAAIRNDPAYAVARENLGDLYMMLAARSYNDALKLAPQNRAAADKERGVKSLLDGQAPSGQSQRNR